jgi:hypothetical protein
MAHMHRKTKVREASKQKQDFPQPAKRKVRTNFLSLDRWHDTYIRKRKISFHYLKSKTSRN